MNRHEDQYLQALQSFSKPSREHWDVTAIDEAQFDLRFRGDPAIYQYWDATECVTFGLRMAQEALDHDLREESRFIQKFDTVYARVNATVSMNNSDMTLLIRSCLQNGGDLSNHRRKQLTAKGHPVAVLEQAQRVVHEVLGELDPNGRANSCN